LNEIEEPIREFLPINAKLIFLGKDSRDSRIEFCVPVAALRKFVFLPQS
jgi:hypothetical protein